MVTGRPLFPGSTVEEELHFIFKLLGENQSASLISLPLPEAAGPLRSLFLSLSGVHVSVRPNSVDDDI